ncbi:MAG: zincin-like metallopeptidase domain-containing protein [Rhodospirillales bacterium]
MTKRNFRSDVAEEMIRQIEAGTAPWQKPWQPGVVRLAPHNPVSDVDYRGINAWWLEIQGREDPRWMTYRQAAGAGVQVRKGEKGTSVEYWKWNDRRPALDDDGNPITDENGKPKTVTVRLSRPKVFYATVFNAEQIDGLEPLVVPEAGWSIDDRANDVLQQSNVPMHFDQSDRAFYNPVKDEIRMPAPAAFKESYEFYATALHELGHATGHRDRLAREFGPFGSSAYAKEELRAEMASYMLTTELGLGHYPERHAAYVESWLKALKDDRNLLFQAARDAETMRTWIMEPEKRRELEQSAGRRLSVDKQEELDMNEAENKPRVYLAVPFAEKDEAKQLGARWDRKAKSWYVPAALDQASFSKWMGDAEPKAPSLSPQDEFAEACRKHGLVLEEPPVMDGRWHRVQVEDDKRGQKSGSYKGYIDGRPSGLIMNYRSGDDVQKWVATGEALDPAEFERLKAESAKRKAELHHEIRATQKKVAKVAFGIFENAPAAPADHAYLERKGIDRGDLRQDENGNLLVAMRTADGFLMNVQKIAPDGTKRFLKQGRKEGLMHVLEGREDRPVVITEGYATGASILAATGRTTVVAFDAGNLESVAKQVRERHPDRPLVIAAEDDRDLKKNVGVEKATSAALAVGGTVAIPAFTDDEKARGMTDFNDLALSRGDQALADQIDRAVAPDRQRRPSHAPARQEMGR